MSKMQGGVKAVLVLGAVWIAGHWFASNWSGEWVADRATAKCVAELEGQIAIALAQGSATGQKAQPSVFLEKRKEIVERSAAAWRQHEREQGKSERPERLEDGLPYIDPVWMPGRDRLYALARERDEAIKELEKQHPPSLEDRRVLYEQERIKIINRFSHKTIDRFYSPALRDNDRKAALDAIPKPEPTATEQKKQSQNTPVAFCACRRDEAVADRAAAMMFTASLGLMKRDIFTALERDTVRCGKAPRGNK